MTKKRSKEYGDERYYCTTEDCAIASLGVENVVFGVSYEAFSQLTPVEASPVDRESLLQEFGIRMKLTGLVLEDEGLHVFEWWGGDFRPLEELIAEMAAVKKKMIRNCEE